MHSSQDEWPRLEALLDRALDMDEHARSVLLEEVRADDPALADELGTLLRAAETTGGPLDGSVVDLLGDEFLSEVTDQGQDALAAGHRLGAYRIVSVLGMGGMGRVFLAERADGQFEQRVALKVLRWDAAGPDVVRRFKLERQVLASLEHPGIARLLDGGITEDGLPYLVMELVEGTTIDQYCAQRASGLSERIRLFLEVCASVQYAHANLVVHRDLKPLNILVTEAGRTKLLDFGVAKLLDASDAAITHADGAPITPKYAAPEQVLGDPVTTATDVYALGVLLHELLAGGRPHEADDPGPTEIARRIVSEDPALPSRSAQERAGREQDDGLPSPTALKGDLDSILIKALRRRPDDRYSSVDQFASDLRRYLGNEPVVARDAGIPYRVRRFVRRHRVGVMAMVAVLASLGVGTGVALSQARQAVAESRRALEEADRADRIATALGGVFDVANPFEGGSGGEISARDLLDRGVADSYENFSDDPSVLASMLVVLGRGYYRIGSYDDASEHLAAAVSLLGDGGDPGTLESALAGQGNVALARREFVEADGLFREALSVRRSLGGPPSVDEARILGGLATAQVSLGNAAEARELSEQQYAMLTEFLPAYDPLVLVAQARTARILRVEGALAESEALYLDVLRVQREHLDPMAPQLPETLNNLAFVRSNRGDLEGAEAAYRESLEILDATVGPAHRTTMLVRRNLSGTFDRAGRLGSAEVLLMENVEFARADSPEGDRGVEGALRSLASAYLKWGEGAKAEATLLEIHDLDLPETAVTRAFLDIDLAAASVLQGHHSEAGSVRSAAFDVIRAAGSLNSSARGRLEWLAGIYDDIGENEIAALHRDFLVAMPDERR